MPEVNVKDVFRILYDSRNRSAGMTARDIRNEWARRKPTYITGTGQVLTILKGLMSEGCVNGRERHFNGNEYEYWLTDDGIEQKGKYIS